jgi:enoyl-CoA hydratase
VSEVLLERHESVRHLVLNAPERRNALNRSMLADFAAAVREVAADPDARALVVSGTGRSFCAGADLTSLFGDPARPTARIRDDLKDVYASFLSIRDLTIPTIAAVGGHAVGAGVNIALACDVVVAGKDARFVLNFAEIGLHPGGGSTWLLTRRLGAQRAMAILLAGETVDAETAMRADLVAECVDNPVARARELAAGWAGRDPDLARNLKRAVQLAETSPLATVLEFESWAQAASVSTPAFAQLLTRFQQGRGKR